MKVHRLLHAEGIPIALQIEMRDLAQRMNSGIRSPGALDDDTLAAKAQDRLLQQALNRKALRLRLPADEGRSVIFDGDAIARHGRS